MCRWIYIFCVLSALCFKGLNCVHIKDITVPSMLLIDSDDDENQQIVLDCDYELSFKDTSLVVKWYKDDEVIYQWIRGQTPSVFPQFSDVVNVNYEQSKHEDHRYSSMALINPSIDTTGKYKCVVRSAASTDSMEKRLQVIDIRNHTLQLFHHRVENETQLECTVDNVYPKPILILSTIDDDEEVFIMSQKVNVDENGLYNATTIAVISDDDEDVDTYSCTVTFADMPINLTTTAVSNAMQLYWHWHGILLSIIFPMFSIVLDRLSAGIA